MHVCWLDPDIFSGFCHLLRVYLTQFVQFEFILSILSSKSTSPASFIEIVTLLTVAGSPFAQFHHVVTRDYSTNILSPLARSTYLSMLVKVYRRTLDRNSLALHWAAVLAIWDECSTLRDTCNHDVTVESAHSRHHWVL